MQKFRGLEQIKITIWESSCKLSNQMAVNLFQYIAGISKYALRKYEEKGNEESGLTDLITNFITYASTDTANAPTFFNARLAFMGFDDVDVSGYPPVTSAKLQSSYVELGSYNWSENVDGDTKWSMDFDNNGHIMVDLGITISRNDDEIIQARATLADSLLKVHGPKFKKLYFSVCSTSEPCCI